jgi:hypothetical protein
MQNCAKFIRSRELEIQPLIKKWLGNRDASSFIAQQKTNALGKSTFISYPNIHKFSAFNKPDISQALQRVRRSGYVTSAKIRNKPGNAPVPSWPAGPLIRSCEAECVIDYPAWYRHRPVVGNPTQGQYTTMRSKGVPAPPTMADTGVVRPFRYRSAVTNTDPPVQYH